MDSLAVSRATISRHSHWSCSAPDIAGQDVANPFSLVLSMALLLAWRGERAGAARFAEAASAIEGAVAEAIKTGRATKDVGGKLATAATGQPVVELLTAGCR